MPFQLCLRCSVTLLIAEWSRLNSLAHAALGHTQGAHKNSPSRFSWAGCICLSHLLQSQKARLVLPGHLALHSAGCGKAQVSSGWSWGACGTRYCTGVPLTPLLGKHLTWFLNVCDHHQLNWAAHQCRPQLLNKYVQTGKYGGARCQRFGLAYKAFLIIYGLLCLSPCSFILASLQIRNNDWNQKVEVRMDTESEQDTENMSQGSNSPYLAVILL